MGGFDGDCEEGVSGGGEKGVLPLGGKQPTKKVRLDASRTEEVFGIRFEGYETQVKSVAKHYLELVEAKV